MKKLNHIIIFLLCFVTIGTINAQSDSTFKFIKCIAGKFNYFTVDNLDNIYLVSSTNQLKKINANGDSIGVFNDIKRYGNLSSIDATNPLKTLLYYKNFSTILILDRFLKTITNIDLKKQNIFSAPCITTSYDNNIWIFDEQDSKLKKISDVGNVLQETIDCRVYFDSVPSPSQIIDKENFVYLYDSTKGFYIFDYYGTFKNRIPFLNWNNIEITSKNIYGFSKNKLQNYKINSFVLKEYTLPSFLENYILIKVINNKVYLLNTDGIYIYYIL